MPDDGLPLADRLRAAADAAPPPMPPCDGRGIVICAGGARLFTCAWVLIAMLRRHLGCRLPIEVWHIGPAELGPPMQALLEPFEVDVVDALQVAQRHPVAVLGGWQLKTYALLHTRFRHVLLLDADNLPVADPAALFDAAAMVESGAIFWPDIVRLKPGNPIWSLTGLAAETGPSLETGQILLDKARHWRALALAHWINQRHDAFEDMLYGDKDAFYVAWRMLGAPYHLIPHAPRLLQGTMCQRAPAGEVIFQHRNGHKWMLHGPNPRIEGFRLEDTCFALLSELRTLWDGTVFNPPPRSLEARAVEATLSEIGRFRLVWVSSHEHLVRLHPGHLIENGGADARHWFVADGEAAPEVRVLARGALRCVLRQDTDGSWRGSAGGFAVELQPLAPDTSPTARQGQGAILALAAALLDRARQLDDAAWRDHAVTLAVLAGLEAALPPFLHACAAGDGPRARLARAALSRHAATPTPHAPPRAGTGWQARSGDIDVQTDRIPKR